jgi:hypothetical protein
MPQFRIHRLKDQPRQNFRWAAHMSGASLVRPRDYEPGTELDARNCYDAWIALRGSAAALGVGDLLETESGELRIYKYVGFEEARWVAPESAREPAARAAGASD